MSGIKITDREIKNGIYELLEKYGFEDTDLDGYEYLIHILFHAIKTTTNPAKKITARTYPETAKAFNAKPGNIERCLRHVIFKSDLMGLTNSKAISKLYYELLREFDLDLI